MSFDFKSVSNFRDVSINNMSRGKLFRSAKLSNLNDLEKKKKANPRNRPKESTAQARLADKYRVTTAKCYVGELDGVCFGERMLPGSRPEEPAARGARSPSRPPPQT